MKVGFSSGIKSVLSRAALLLLGLSAPFLAPVATAQPANDRVYRVLVLYWDNKDFPGNVRFDENFKTELLTHRQGRIEYYPEYIETTRFPNQNQAFFRDYLRQKYADRPMDVVVATADIPLNFFLQYRKELFPNSPIVFIATNPPGPDLITTGPGLTGIVHQSTHRETLGLALKLHPDTEQVFVISGSAEHDQRFEKVARQELSGFEDKVKINYLTDLPLNELIAKTSSLPPKSLMLYVWQQTLNEQGKLLETYEVLARFAPTSSAPIYGMGSGNLGNGIVGGYLQGPDTNGVKTADMAVRILNGTRPQDIRVESAPTVPVFDWRQLKRWGINESELPAGSVVRFRVVTFWEQYRWYVIGIAAVVILQALLIALLLFLHARRRQAEKENLRLARLAEAEHRHLDEVVSNVPGLVWEALLEPNATGRKTTFMSDYVEKMLGYTSAEWLAKPSGFGLELIPDQADRERVARESQAVVTSGRQGFFQNRWKTKDGRVIWVESYLTPTVDQEGKVVGLRGVTLDITGRKQAEEAAAQAEQKDRAILNAVPDLMFLQTPDGIYLDFHAKDLKDLVVPPEKLLGKNMREVLPRDLAAQFLRCFAHAEEGGEPQILEYKLTINETDRWFESRMVRSGENILSVVRDITQRVFTEAALKKNEAQLAAIIESAMDAIITIDENQRIVLFNTAAESIFECPAAEAMGQPLDRFIPERFRAALRDHIHKLDTRNADRRLMGRPGDLFGLKNSVEEFPIEASISHVDLNGQMFYTIILRDITERKLAEAALQESALNYRSIFNAANDAIFVLALETGAILDVNERMCEMYGYTVDEARLLTPADLSSNEPPFTQKDAMVVIQKAGDGKPQLFEWRAKKRSGELFWVEVSLRHILLGGKRCLLAIVRDVTERKQAMDKLRQSEERFGKAFRANPQPMSLAILGSGLYLDVNDSFLAMTGYTREQVIGHTAQELKMWESPESRDNFIRRLRAGGSVANVETKFRTRDGGLRTLLSSAELLEIGGEECLLVASTDITERMLAQQALRESEERFRNMADTAPVMIWVSGPDKLCNYFNQQWLSFTGRRLEEELGNGWAEGVHPDDYEGCLATYLSAFDRREPFRMEYRLRHADGSYRWVYDSGTPRFSAGGEFLGYIGSCLDISDRKKSEEALRTAHEELNRLKNQLQEENIYLREEINLEQNFGEIVGESNALKYVLFKIEQVAPTETTVLITGETGTGKELVARAIHNASGRRDRPLVKVNCGALSPSLIESELFGHEKGAFTGAAGRKIGRFELADGATIFLDEIGELPTDLQVKLLRVIQEGEFERLGSSATIKVDVRIIAATNRNLDLDVRKGLFREDLWYRLNVFPITVPPLRERREDIPLLVENFTRMFAKKLRKVITSISPTTLESLRQYSWPGNVRELANVIERAVINSHSPVLRIVEEFGEPVAEKTNQTNRTLEEVERDYVARILTETNWRIEGQHGAARVLGMNPSTLRARLIKLRIPKPGQG